MGSVGRPCPRCAAFPVEQEASPAVAQSLQRQGQDFLMKLARFLPLAVTPALLLAVPVQSLGAVTMVKMCIKNRTGALSAPKKGKKCRRGYSTLNVATGS